MAESIWLSWETHRRSRELAQRFNSRYYELDYSDRPAPVRYFLSLSETVGILLRERPAELFIQSPSIFLAFAAALLRPILRYRLVLDVHNIVLDADLGGYRGLRWLIRYSFRAAHYVIVTNTALEPAVRRLGGSPLILPDRLPHIERKPLPSRFQSDLPIVTLISSFADDEPLEELIAGALQVKKPFVLYITGRRKKAGALLRFESERIRFTDFLPEEEYEGLIANSNLLVDLTTRPDCLVCGAYEAVAVGVPILLSDTPALRETFGGGALFAGNDIEHYRQAFEHFFEQTEDHRPRISVFQRDFNERWEKQAEAVLAAIRTGSTAVFGKTVPSHSKPSSQPSK